MQTRKERQGFKLVKIIYGKYLECPIDWSVSKLSEICSFKKGLSYNTKDLGYEDSNYLVNLHCFKKGGGFKKEGLKFFSGEEKSSALIQKNDLLIAITEITRQNEIIGFPILIPNLGNKRKIFHSLDTCKLNPKVGINKEYLYYFLCTNFVHIWMIAYTAGITIQHLHIDSVKDIKIFFPSKTEQEKIVSILSNIDCAIQNTNQQIEQSQLLKKGMMLKLLTKGIGHTKFKKTKMGEIPEEWEIKKIKDISTLLVPLRDKPKQFEGNIPWLTLKDFDGKYVSKSKMNNNVTKEMVEKMNLTIFPIGTVICSISATIGICSITTVELITNQRFIGVVPNIVIDKEFLYYFLNTQKENILRSGTGSIHSYTSKGEFGKLQIVIPPLNEQKQITSILSNVDSQIIKETLQKSNLEILKKGLIQKLLTGKIRVKF